MAKNKTKELNQRRQKIAKRSPSIKEILRGTFIECYLTCIRENCSCHKDKKYRHGPYYRVSYGKGGRMHHIYVPLSLKEKVKLWTDNYRKLWKCIEEVSEVNIKLIKAKVNK